MNFSSNTFICKNHEEKKINKNRFKEVIVVYRRKANVIRIEDYHVIFLFFSTFKEINLIRFDVRKEVL